MGRKRVLVVHPRVTAVGGSNALAAWTLQALRHRHDVALATLQPVDHAALNRAWGTDLQAGDFRVELAPRWHLRGLKLMPTPSARLELSLTMRHGRNVARAGQYDVILGTQNELDLCRRSIQYIHYPWAHLPRPKHEMRWYHGIPGMLAAYYAVCNRIAGLHVSHVRDNLTLVNSGFIAQRTRETHGIDALVVYPPVTGGSSQLAWKDRENAFLAVGRLGMEKRWEMAVAVVEEVRRRGLKVGLTLVGQPQDGTYYDRLRDLSASRPWFRILTDLSREDLLATMARHRYGIHTMYEEHFGIAPAELVRAGCLTFVHNSGGPAEIVGHEIALVFEDVTEAADKIQRALSDPDLESRLRAHLQGRAPLFSAEVFCETMREVVETFNFGPALS